MSDGVLLPGNPNFDPSQYQSLDFEDLLETRIMQGDRKRYYEKLDRLQRSRIDIADQYLIQACTAAVQGVRPSLALKQSQWKYIVQMMNTHPVYFSGHGFTKMLGI